MCCPHLVGGALITDQIGAAADSVVADSVVVADLAAAGAVLAAEVHQADGKRKRKEKK